VKYLLGLDLGTNSIGWAAVTVDESGEPRGVLDLGVRIFPDGRNPKDKSSLAVQRRVPRGMRRRRDRYLERREDLTDALVACGLMPPDAGDRKALEALDPYRLRAKALDAPVTPHELGRALFHLNQRRGFKSNRKAKKSDEGEEKKTRADITELRRRISQSRARTLGE
jgi:CRISPR-associated endonuclease Csn1